MVWWCLLLKHQMQKLYKDFKIWVMHIFETTFWNMTLHTALLWYPLVLCKPGKGFCMSLYIFWLLRMLKSPIFSKTYKGMLFPAFFSSYKTPKMFSSCKCYKSVRTEKRSLLWILEVSRLKKTVGRPWGDTKDLQGKSSWLYNLIKKNHGA